MRNKDSAQNPNIPSAKHIYAHVQLSDNHIFTIYFENGYPIKTKIKGGFALKFAPSDSDYGFSCIKNGDSLDLISYRNSSNGDSWFKR
ncbi:MAG: hypothetical protein KG003_15640 [Bacteroidetes bacterium]|nr:hypothetical protein [Bacteroidota bacterium]